jgi:hypothetical protein
MSFGNTFLLPRNARAGRDGSPAVSPRVDHIAYTVEPWDKKAVEAELKKRGLEPHEDQQSWHVKDPDGFDVQIASAEMKP